MGTDNFPKGNAHYTLAYQPVHPVIEYLRFMTNQEAKRSGSLGHSVLKCNLSGVVTVKAWETVTLSRHRLYDLCLITPILAPPPSSQNIIALLWHACGGPSMGNYMFSQRHGISITEWDSYWKMSVTVFSNTQQYNTSYVSLYGPKASIFRLIHIQSII